MAYDHVEIVKSRVEYGHKPVTDEDGFRLIILEPSTDQAAPLSLRLNHSRLSYFENDKVDQYTALSYVWGDSTATSSVEIDDKYLSVTASLDDALRNIRHKEEAIKIWADGICIDQTDWKDKEKQVALMGQIYEMASNTVVYLGAEAEGSDKVMGEARNSIATRYVGTVHATELRSLMIRPWFTRTWIYQELVLSKSVRFQAGRSSCSWEEFYTLIDKDAIRPGREPKPGQKTDPNSVQSVLHRLNLRHSRTYGIVNGTIIKQFRSARRAFHGEEIELEATEPNPSPKDVRSELIALIRVLEERRGLGVTDPRDMIYAYLGLHRGTGIEVSYSVSPNNFFIFFAKYLLKHCGSELLFEHVHKSTYPFWWSSRKVGLDLPSWVPDWTCEAPISNIRIFLETAVANKLVASGELDDGSSHNAKAAFKVPSQVWLYPKAHPESIATVGRILITILELENQHSKIYTQEIPDPNHIKETLSVFLVRLVCENPGWKLVEFPVRGKLTVFAIPSVAKVGDVISLFHGSSRAYLLRPCFQSTQASSVDNKVLDDEIRREFNELLKTNEPGRWEDDMNHGCTDYLVSHFEIIGGVAVASPDLLMDSEWKSVSHDAKNSQIIVLH